MDHFRSVVEVFRSSMLITGSGSIPFAFKNRKSVRHSDLLHQELRTHSSVPIYFSVDFEAKYLIQENRFVIKNITADDCRLYFCAEKINSITIVNTVLLTSVKNLIF